MVVFEENKPSMRQVLEMSALLGAGGAGDEPPGAHSRSCARRCWVLAAAEEGRAAAAEGFRAGGGEAGVLGRRCRGRAWGSGVGGGNREGRAGPHVTFQWHPRGWGQGEHVMWGHAGFPPQRQGCPVHSGPSVRPSRRAPAARRPRPPCPHWLRYSPGRGNRAVG